MDFRSKIFPVYAQINYANRQMTGSSPSVSYVFLYFIPKKCQIIYFFKHENQVRPMSILNHTGGADLSHSRLVYLSPS